MADAIEYADRQLVLPTDLTTQLDAVCKDIARFQPLDGVFGLYLVKLDSRNGNDEQAIAVMQTYSQGRLVVFVAIRNSTRCDIKKECQSILMKREINIGVGRLIAMRRF